MRREKPLSPVAVNGFNPRTPCGVRLLFLSIVDLLFRFQSTHSLRSATIFQIPQTGQVTVSIHALLAECDQVRKSWLNVPGQFQSTHSLRSATIGNWPGCFFPQVSIHALLAECDFYEDAKRFAYIVSIHALLAECDSFSISTQEIPVRFNPRTPCGVRHRAGIGGSFRIQFQSTHSLRSATIGNWPGCFFPQVSIHALLAECDKPRTTKRNTN